MPDPLAENRHDMRGGPEHFARLAAAMGSPPESTGSWDDLHVQTMRLKPGGWTHPGTSYVRLTVPLSEDGRVRRRLLGEKESWVHGVKRRGTISVTPPDAEGEWEWSDPSHFGLVFLPSALLREAAEERSTHIIPNLLRPVFAESDATATHVLASVMAEITQRAHRSRLLISSAAMFLAAYLLSRYGAAGPTPPLPTGALDRPRLRRVIEAVEAKLDHDWTVHELAQEAGLSPFWFAHAFKTATGVAPRRYIQQRRLQRARRMLAGTNIAVIDIALSCGFESQSWFTTVFKRQYGAAPATFRRRLR